MTERLPTIFFGHGSPMIALQQNDVTRRWGEIARSIPRPRAILSISAHWLTRGTCITAQPNPPTIHDFGGFPEEMFRIRYPARGDRELGERIAALAAPEAIGRSTDWGFDHGTWTVLMKCWPDADIPVVQLSLDVGKTPAQHFAFGQRLRALRDEGVLIMGTGNIVHNLRTMVRIEGVAPHPYARKFSDFIRDAIAADDPASVIDFAKAGREAQLSVPTPDHFWPLLYVLGARHEDDVPTFDPNFIEFGAIDMTTVVLRGRAA